MSTGPRTGVLEQFLGELIGRGDIRWIRPNEFEYTVTLSPTNPKMMGFRARLVRDYYYVCKTSLPISQESLLTLAFPETRDGSDYLVGPYEKMPL